MSEHEQWEECPRGILTGMAEELRRNQRRPSRLGAAWGGLALVFILGAGFLLTSGLLTTPVSDITCDEVAPLLAQYHDQTLSATRAQQVERHLSACPHCKQKYNKSFPEEVRRSDSPADPAVAMLLPSS